MIWSVHLEVLVDRACRVRILDGRETSTKTLRGVGVQQ